MVALATGCSGMPAARSGTSATASTSSPSRASLAVGDANAPMPAPGTCTIGSRNGQPMPDPACTPGAINPAVTQATIGDTICKSGWTKTVRPPTSKTNRMKAESARSYNLGQDVKGEYDHLVSLEMGGAPDDPRNLWVEPGTIPNPKDAVENKLNDAVCSGLIPLATAQSTIAKNWVTAFDDAGLRVTGGKICLRDTPTQCATRGGDGTGE
ncbi:hypothetical protein [Amycolatopsis sp. GM8]|uniref:hypothetical protein n=1 Tax=Amycolatopsis sp. GM8 TaxID=2896530 RepID=UPI001F4013BC|nr:hypothetical protein [Amycolatopsis sp. GM8]